MPFVSKAQQRMMFATHPAMAREFASHMTKAQMKALPARKGKVVRKGGKRAK